MRRALLVLFLLLSLALPAAASTYTVDDLGDAGDANPGDDVCNTAGNVCTLRAALEEAQAHAGADTVAFLIAGTIIPATPFPSLTQPVTVDGTLAPGYTGVPMVIVDGDYNVAIGFHFDAGSQNSELVGLQVSGFDDAAVVIDADTVTIRRNYLGPIIEGTTPNSDGLQLNGNGSTIGGEDGQGNVISGNDRYGILVSGTNHDIRDNFIGTDPAGLTPLPNGEDGISVIGTEGPLTIGSATAGEENVISGNFNAGIRIDSGSGTVIAGNYIGTDVTGSTYVPNWIGVLVGASGNTIGTVAAGNVISGNDDDGLDIFASDTIVRNNIIGLDATGTAAVDNLGFGVAALLASNVDIGGSAADEGNVISYNGAAGVFFFEVDASRITGNLVGLNAAGTSALGNFSEGIVLLDSSDVTVASNVVSANFGGIVDAGGIANIIESNRVGTTADGSAALGNVDTGIELALTLDTTVRSNVVSANGGHGIETTLGAIGSIIHSNTVGLSADLSTPLGNTLDGINVCDTSEETVVGSVALGGNIISANGENGIGVEPSALSGNTWAANSIFNNGELGIDIARDGVTANDAMDPDEGPNQFQNFPVLVAAVTTPTASQIRGTLNTTPSIAFTIHFYSSPAADPSGFGEGQTYLGAASGTTDASGNAAFLFTGPALTVGHVVTATATTTDGSSEFSAAVMVTAAPAISFSSATYSVGEAGVSATITVTRSGNLDAISTVDFTTSDNTADAGADYTTASGTLTFVVGDTTETFTVPVTNDGTDEPDELVNLTLSNPTAATLAAPSTAQLTITDDDLPPSVTIDNVAATEGAPLTFTLTLSHLSASDVMVNYSTANDTTTVSDYTAQTGVATITAGNLTTTINIATTVDTTFEPDETLFVNLTGATNASIADSQGIGTITNDDAQPAVTIADDASVEGTTLIFTLTLSNPSADDVTVSYSTADGTATVIDSDYTPQTSVATITAGNTSTTINIATTADATSEPDETLLVNLTGSTNASIADNQAIGTITNDDAQPAVTIADDASNEGTALSFTLTLSNPSASNVNINYSTADGSASAISGDYTPQTSVAMITAGSISTTINIATTADATSEPDETLFVNLTASTNASIADNQAIGTITNDDGQPSVTIADDASSEGTALIFTLTLSNPSASDITINYTTADGSATAISGDYTPQTSVATITAGNTSTTINIATTSDTSFEPDETLFVNLTGASNATIADNQATGTITNDDAEPTVSVDNDSSNEGLPVTFTLSLSNPSASDVAVGYTTANQTATAGSDYTAQTSTATIAAGNLTTTVNIATSTDAVAEPAETFFLNLTSATNATIADNQGVGTIIDANGTPTVTIDDVSQNEGTTFTFTLTLSHESATDITVNYTAADGTADALTDYTAQTGVVTIPFGTTSTTVSVPTTADVAPESNETFFVNLTASNATIADNQGLGTILNDDAFTADLNITKSATTPTFMPGEQVTYTITISNLGPSAATSLTVTDVLPAGATFVSASSPDATCTGTTTITCTIPSLANGASTAITLIVTANGTAPIANTATVVAAAPADPTPFNNAASATISPTGIDEVPTLSEWALLLLAMALGLVALRRT